MEQQKLTLSSNGMINIILLWFLVNVVFSIIGSTFMVAAAIAVPIMFPHSEGLYYVEKLIEIFYVVYPVSYFLTMLITYKFLKNWFESFFLASIVAGFPAVLIYIVIG